MRVPVSVRRNSARSRTTRSDDVRRFERLYESNYDAVLAYALARTDSNTARDVVADTFLVAWRRLADVPVEPRAWLIGVARRVLADHRRGTARRQALIAQIGEEPTRDLVDEAGDNAVGRSQILGALQRLSASDQELLRLIAWDGLSMAEAAAVVGCSRATVAVRLHRARKRFESAMEAAEAVIDVAGLPASQRPEFRGTDAFAPTRADGSYRQVPDDELDATRRDDG